MGRFLVIEDDPALSEMVCEAVSDGEQECVRARTLAQGLEQGETLQPDVVFLDLGMPDGNGLRWLSTFLELASRPEVIVITGRGSDADVEEAISLGAWDFLHKPFTLDTLLHLVRQALRYRRTKTGQTEKSRLERPAVIGNSFALQSCLRDAERAARSDGPCLIAGETGVGKELMAQTIHANSARRNGPFIPVDCASLTDQLAESVLFGHRKGAFTGAHADKKGLVESADQGVLFLDEIGELPLETQKSLLRVLQERRFRPLGTVQEKSSDFRLLSATNRNLHTMVEQGTFRQDLFFRILGNELAVPPLRQRLDDLAPLATAFLGSICQQYRLPSKGWSADFIPALQAYEWPGNVRELKHCLENCFMNAFQEPILYPQHLPDYIRVSLRSRSGAQKSGDAAEAVGPVAVDPQRQSLKQAREYAGYAAEKEYLKQLLNHSQGKIEDFARRAGVSKPHFYNLLRKHGLRVP